MSRPFTQKEQDLMALMNKADNLVRTLRDETRNKAGFEDTIHPLENTVKQLAWAIDEMLTRMEFVD